MNGCGVEPGLVGLIAGGIASLLIALVFVLQRFAEVLDRIDDLEDLLENDEEES